MSSKSRVERVVEGLVPVRRPTGGRVPRLPVAALSSTGTSSMTYGIAAVDASGRVSERGVLRALGWRTGDRVRAWCSGNAVIVRSCVDGELAVAERGRVPIPSLLRERCAIRPGDRVMLAGSAEYGVLIVHTMSTVEAMLAQHHAAHDDQEPGEAL